MPQSGIQNLLVKFLGMGVDILFIIMAAYGFYFGYAYGLIRVVMFVIALIVALAVAMLVTPATTRLINHTLEIDSALIPFIAFVVTLVGIMLVAQIVLKLFQETVSSQQVNQMTQGLGGLMMSVIFIFLFSVLVTFFSAAHVIRPEKVKQTSFFYPIIEKIPVRGSDIMVSIAPYMEDFVKYMRRAFDRLENGDKELNDDFLEGLEDDYYNLDSVTVDPPMPDTFDFENDSFPVNDLSKQDSMDDPFSVSKDSSISDTVKNRPVRRRKK